MKKKILISTGGYMSLPVILAAKLLQLDIYLFEPNLVIGRANKLFLGSCKKIFCYSEKILNATVNCIGIWNLTTHPYYNYWFLEN